MKFFKENSYDIVKLFVNQIGIAIFSMALYTAISIAVPETSKLTSGLYIFISVAATLFYLVLLYMAMWENGAKDAIRIETGKMQPMMHKGFLMGLLSNIPNFILCGAALIFISVFVSGGAAWLEQVFAVLNLFFGFLESMFLGIIINVLPIAEDAAKHTSDMTYLYRTVLYFAAPVIPIATTSFGYWMGCKNKRIFKMSGTKNQAETKTQK